MDVIHSIGEWIWGLLSAFGGYLMYQHKRMDRRVDNLEQNFHRLDKSQSELHVEIREIKADIRDLKHSIDRLIEKL